jgi:hypothetical protein
VTEKYPKPRRIVRRRQFVYVVLERHGESDRLAMVSTWKTRDGASGDVEEREADRDRMTKCGFPSYRTWFVAAIEVRR